jgi:hypothetical protein
MKTKTRLLVLASLLAGCSSDHSNDPPGFSTPATVRGCVLDDRGQAVAGASVTLVGSALQVQANENGRFVFEVGRGAHQVDVHFGQVKLCTACFTVDGGEAFDLGDLYPGRASGCDQPTGCPGDQDCDGLSDADETTGWDVMLIMGDGSVAMRAVQSDPLRVDTDADGLTDAEEMAARTDPSRRDTDGDGLPDFAELRAYKCNPWVVDSDGDSCGPDGNAVTDPNLWDGNELLLSKTSPALADTDGDGITDWEEVHSGGTHPLAADLPRMSLDLYGDPTLVLNVTDVTTHQQTSISSLLEKESEGHQRTDTESTRMSIENTVSIHSELEAGTGTWPPSFEAKVTTDTEFKHGYTTESLSSWTEESVRESQQNYETTTQGITNISYDDGLLWTAIKIVNDSDLAFRVGDLRIVAQRMKPGGSFEAVGTLRLGLLGANNTWEPFEGAAGEFLLGPSVEYIGLVGADQLPAQTMRALVSNPTALLFEIGSYSLFRLDPFGVPTINFATIGESVIQRTGLLVIDRGNGAVERHMVATNVYRYPDGTGRGIRLGDALDLLGIPYETAPHAVETSRRVLCKLGSVEAFLDEQDPHICGFWIVGGNGAVFDERITQDFADLVLHSGERINLTFVRDADGDSIFDGEEYLLGTNPRELDSDHDGLSDYEESKIGWEVAPQGIRPYAVNSDPRFADLDEDFLLDGAERTLGTDPYRKDTDGDGYEDGFDPNPLVPPCMDARQLLLSAWWNGAATGSTATDVWTLDEVQNNGQMYQQNVAGSIAEALGLDTVFVFNQDGDRIVVADPPASSPTRTGLSPVHEFSVAMRVRWAGPPPAVPPGTWGTVLTKGPRTRGTFAISIKDTGQVRVSVFRRVWDHRWGWLFGWVDGLAEDYRRDERTELASTNPLPLNEWALVTATFGHDYMTLYVDGVQVAQVSVNVWSQSATIRTNSTTEYLNGNADPLRIGADQAETGQTLEGRFNGYLDNVQYFHRALTASEVGQLFTLGACPQ